MEGRKLKKRTRTQCWTNQMFLQAKKVISQKWTCILFIQSLKIWTFVKICLNKKIWTWSTAVLFFFGLSQKWYGLSWFLLCSFSKNVLHFKPTFPSLSTLYYNFSLQAFTNFAPSCHSIYFKFLQNNSSMNMCNLKTIN